MPDPNLNTDFADHFDLSYEYKTMHRILVENTNGACNLADLMYILGHSQNDFVAFGDDVGLDFIDNNMYMHLKDVAQCLYEDPAISLSSENSRRLFVITRLFKIYNKDIITQ